MATLAKLYKLCRKYGLTAEEIERIIQDWMKERAEKHLQRIVLRISPSQNGAIRRLKNAVYALVSNRNLNMQETKKKWGPFISRVIDIVGHHLGDKKYFTRLEFYYTIEDDVLIPKRLILHTWEAKPHKTIIIDERGEEIVLEGKSEGSSAPGGSE